MQEKSHVDPAKLDKVPSHTPFEYKDVVSDEFAEENHTEDGKRFKAEVESGKYDNVEIDKDNGSRLVYRKR